MKLKIKITKTIINRSRPKNAFNGPISLAVNCHLREPFVSSVSTHYPEPEKAYETGEARGILTLTIWGKDSMGLKESEKIVLPNSLKPLTQQFNINGQMATASFSLSIPDRFLKPELIPAPA